MVTLCFDFGNSRLKAAVFIEDHLKEVISLPDDADQTVKNVLDLYNPDKSILSSVINHNTGLESILSSSTIFHKVSHDTKLSFTVPSGKKETIGADRLAMMAAAVHFFPGKNNLIIGLGSCITYNFVNQFNQFLGGSISPGMHMRFKSMHDYTAKLPLINEVSFETGIPLIGYDTYTNMVSGVVSGMASEVDGIINKYLERYANFNALLTGGNSAFFASQLKNKIFADSNFLFKGLYALSELNNCGN